MYTAVLPLVNSNFPICCMTYVHEISISIVIQKNIVTQFIITLLTWLEYCSRGCFSLTCSDNVLALNNTILYIYIYIYIADNTIDSVD